MLTTVLCRALSPHGHVSGRRKEVSWQSVNLARHWLLRYYVASCFVTKSLIQRRGGFYRLSSLECMIQKKKDGVNDAQAVTYGQLSKQQSSFVLSFSGIILNIPNGEAAGSAGL